MDQTADRIARTIATEIAASPAQVTAAVGLLDGGATVPFVARYRKEVTGGLDDTQLRTLSDRLTYLDEERQFLAEGRVVVQTTSGKTLRSEELTWDEAARRLRTDGFVRITTPEEQLQGYRLDADENLFAAVGDGLCRTDVGVNH